MVAHTLPDIQGYRVQSQIGHGGIGIVYLATRADDPSTTVAIKVLQPGILVRPKEILRFAREGHVGQSLHHPNILPVIELGEWQENPFLVMEYVDGATLHQKITERRRAGMLAGDDTKPSDMQPGDGLLGDLRIVAQVARALDFAHSHGIVHRDVKPGNILVRRDGHPYLIDFGLARDLMSDTKLTSASVVMGTPQYMAPEQLKGDIDNIGPATDIYALGATLFEVVTGRMPFSGRNYDELREKVLNDEPADVTALAPTAPRGLSPILRRALEKEPAHRYASAGEMARDLEQVIQGLAPESHAIELYVQRVWRRIQRNKHKLSGAACIVLALMLVSLWKVKRDDDQQRRVDQTVSNVAMDGDRGELERVKRSIQAAARLDPKNPVHDLLMAEIFKNFGMNAPAQESLESAKAKGFEPDGADPKESKDRFNKALYWMQSKDFAQTESCLLQILAQDPKFEAALLILYQLQFRRGEREEGLHTFERYVEQTRARDAEDPVLESWLLELKGDYEGALRALEPPAGRPRGATPPGDDLHRHRGRLYGRLERFADAERELRTAVEHDEKDAASWINLAFALFKQGRKEEAAGHVSKGVALKDQAAGFAARGLALDEHLVSGDALLANLEFERSLALDEHLVSGDALLAKLEFGKMHFAEATKHLKAALALDPSLDPEKIMLARSQFEEAEALSREGLDSAALEKFAEALDNDPKLLGALIYLAQDAWIRGADAEKNHAPSQAQTWFAKARERFVKADAVWTSTSQDLRSGSAAWHRTFLEHANYVAIQIGRFGVESHLGDEAAAREALHLLAPELAQPSNLNKENALNLAEALAECPIDALRDCLRARQIVELCDLAKTLSDNPDALEILAKIDKLCPP